MARPYSFGKVEIDVGEERTRAGRPRDDTPFRIAVLGDFSGRAGRGIVDPSLAGCKPILVDRDNFEDVMAKLAPELHLPLGGAGGPRMSVRFTELDDFHPDRLFERLGAFRALRETRDRLSDRASFAAAAAELRGPVAPPSPPAPPPTAAPELAPVSLSGLFDQMVEQSEAPVRGGAPTRGLDDLQLLVRRMVAPYLEPKPDPQQAEMVAQVDAAIGGEMRALLHHPLFQELEAAWRGLFFLIRRSETGTGLKIYVIDISKEELAAALRAAADLSDTPVYRLVVEQTVGTPGADPWALLAGNYSFDDSVEDIETLGRMGKVASEAGAPFIAAAGATLLGIESLAETPDARQWRSEPRPAFRALRELPEAPYIGLALPRFLLRLPYGRETDSTELFDFEEMPGPPRHRDYLWGNPAFACAFLIGQAFSDYGWDLRPGVGADIENLPAHLYEHDGDRELKPCAEILMTGQGAEKMLEAGLMPLLSIKGADRVRLARFQSVAYPPAPLAGRWS